MEKVVSVTRADGRLGLCYTIDTVMRRVSGGSMHFREEPSEGETPYPCDVLNAPHCSCLFMPKAEDDTFTEAYRAGGIRGLKRAMRQRLNP